MDTAKIAHIKQKHKEQLGFFEEWARAKDWKMFSPAHSHYDWWIFPVTRPSSAFGDTYALKEALSHDSK
jgi:hypothetical protein